jgi:ABC-type sulfate transport system permease subunit
VTLPNVRWALLYGVLLCNARAMGEFGAVSVVSGLIRGLTNTMPLHVASESGRGEAAVAKMLGGQVNWAMLITAGAVDRRLEPERGYLAKRREVAGEAYRRPVSSP